MKTSFLSILVICFFSISVFSQSNFNKYKYVIVSRKYDFLKEADQYQLNSLSKFLFSKYGFETLMQGEKYPEDLIKNRCLALKSDVLKEPGLFKTKLSITLTDCNDQVVYTSDLGGSREKEYKKAYTEALRNAFKSFESVDYKYEPTESDETTLASSTQVNDEVTEELQRLKQELQTLKEEKKTTAVITPEAETPTVETPTVETPAIKPTDEIPVVKVKEKANSVIVKKESENVLYSQAISGGFQVVDSTPKVIMILITSPLENVFIVKDKNAIVFKENGQWFYSDNGTTAGLLNIKF